MGLTLSTVKNTTEFSRNMDDLRQLPLAIREYYSGRKGRFDRLYDNRQTDTYLQRFRSVKYPVDDRDFGSPNEEICNIFLNLFQDRRTEEAIERYTINRQWTYHPVRQFEKWHTISRFYYGKSDYFWLILVFNKITNPFTALEHFNMVRVPDFSFLQELPYRMTFDFVGVNF